jgi:hypothetical protein
LLNRVCQFVREKLASTAAGRRVATRAEHDIATDRVRAGPNHSGRLRRSAIGVDAHAAEVGAEPGFHQGASAWIERLSGCAQHVVNDLWGLERWRRHIRGASYSLHATVAKVSMERRLQAERLVERRRCGGPMRRWRVHRGLVLFALWSYGRSRSHDATVAT